VAKKATKKKTAVKKASAKKTTAKKPTVKKTAAKKKTAKVKQAKTTKTKIIITKVKTDKIIVKPKKARKEAPLTKEEIKYFLSLLLEKRAEILGDVNSIESEALKKSRLDAAGDLSSMPIHMADVGTDNFEQEFALGLMDSERKILVEINDALKRIVENLYGICEGTNKSISKARLEASPWARYCIEYAIMVEKGMVIEGEKVYDGDQEDVFDLDDLDDKLDDDDDDGYDNLIDDNEDFN
jgi:RNA polymerase-binding transcription factor DksA